MKDFVGGEIKVGELIVYALGNNLNLGVVIGFHDDNLVYIIKEDEFRGLLRREDSGELFNFRGGSKEDRLRIYSGSELIWIGNPFYRESVYSTGASYPMLKWI